MMKFDDLYSCFESHLHTLDIECESQADFISNVVESYWQKINSTAKVAPCYSLDVREYIEFEVLEMLRKTIYGHFDLNHYRRSLRGKSRSN